MNQAQQLSLLLEKISAEMLVQSLWQRQAIDPQALQSQLPFCTDTMNFEQWLQFVLVAKLQHMLEQNIPLPQVSGIAPMAEECFRQKPGLGILIQLIEQLDQLLGPAPTEPNQVH